MQITLSNGTIVEIKTVNLTAQTVDWHRINREYTGDCTSHIEVTDLTVAEAIIKAALEAEGI